MKKYSRHDMRMIRKESFSLTESQRKLVSNRLDEIEKLISKKHEIERLIEDKIERTNLFVKNNK